MAKPIPSSPIVRRDGTSQRSRRAAALDPDHARVDERSILDQLAFAREYGKELVHHGLDDRPDGDLGAFLDPGVPLDDLARLAADPGALVDERSRLGLRPPQALFLTFLKLLEGATGHLDGFTRRHLDFHYRDLLGLSPRGPVPGRVHVLARLARGKEGVLLPRGTLLDGGKDSQGKVRAFATDRDVVVTRAEVARLSSVFVEREVTTLRSAREQNAADPDAALLAMMKLALGDPRPGDALPAYQGAEVDAALLHKLRSTVTFAKTHLFMELYELSSVVRLLENRAQEAAEWTAVNATLQDAARARLGDPEYTFSPAEPGSFATNFDAAVGGPLTFGALAGVVKFEDLYHQRGRQDVQQFITAVVHLDVAAFTAMMQTALRIASEWREINRILELCGRRKRNADTYLLAPPEASDFEASAFEQNLEAAVGPVDWTGLAVSTLADYQQEIQKIEAAFFMAAEDLAFVAGTGAAGGPTEKAWSRAQDLLTEAHRRKETGRRRQALLSLVQTEPTPAAQLEAILRAGLGAEEASPGEDARVLVEKMRPFLGSDGELQFLRLRAVAVTEALPVSLADWERIAVIIEVARRRREGWKEPVPRTVEWLDLHAHEDATQVEATLGLGEGEETPRWKTFGAARPETDPEAAPPAVLGWALSSPLLSLREGHRKIVLTLGFAAEGFDEARVQAALARGPFEVQVSGAKGYRSASLTSLVHGDYQTAGGVTRALPAPLPALQLVVDIDEGEAPLSPLPGGDGAAAGPSLRVLLRPVWDAVRGRFVTLYEPFEHLVLAAVHIKIAVDGIRALSLENDTAVLDPSKPFQPFGSGPAVGSRLHLAHPELCAKRLDSVRFHVKWMKAPADLAAHYAGYAITPDFQARIALRDGRAELPVFDDAPLFAQSGARDPHVLEIADLPAAVALAGPASPYEPLPALAADRPASAWERAFVWQLAPIDFQHQAYPGLASRKAAELSAAMAASATNNTPVNVSAYHVEAPYTPALERIEVDYTASTEVLPGASAAAERLHHVLPFGESAPLPASAGVGPRFLPDHLEYEGELYIGLRDVRAPETVALLFQLAEGSADPDLEPAAVEWSYLSGDGWHSLHHGGLVADGTRGLLASGILELALPAAAPSTLLPGGLYWLRAAVREGARSICDVVAVHTQVVPATFLDRDNAPDVHDAPLPPGTLEKVLSAVRGIAGVEQPYASFGQRPPEQEASFSTRVSERLRHRRRALTTWDYERLVLDRFPAIYKARCVPASAADPDAAGLVRVIVIPEMRGRIPFDPFAPKAPSGLLADIAAYLAERKPPEARLRVQNAVFVGVRVRLLVRFRPGHDEGFHKKKLDDELCRFLSPWAYDDGVDIVMGNRIHAGSIIDFVERRPYVDFVAGITLFRRQGAELVEVPRPESGGYHIAAEQPDEVLVAARGHEIDTSWQYQIELPADLLAELLAGAQGGQKGIGSMRISLDFILQNAAGAGIQSMGIEADFQVG